jgi:bacteriorhodopsin
MNIETTVSLVAAIVYSIFNEMLKAPTIDLSQITQMRYIDWSITTPLIILVMTLFYTGINHPSYQVFLLLIILNWGMLGSGYLGETGTINKWAGFGLGFLFFGLMLLVLFVTCVSNTKNHVVFWVFALIWSGYGIAYLADEETKNLAYNGLDVISKAIFGVVLYLYYGKVLRF